MGLVVGWRHIDTAHEQQELGGISSRNARPLVWLSGFVAECHGQNSVRSVDRFDWLIGGIHHS